jgi:serine/threonine protein kinase
MGVAFLTEGAGRWAVVKMIRSDLSDDRSYRARIARELEAMRRAAGPHTAALLDSDLDGDPAWFAMEFIPGMTLTRHVNDLGPLSEADLVAFAAGLAEVLAAVHAVGIVHRDLKPSNVMLSPTGPRLIDFGIADLAEGTQLTRTGAVLGSTGWLAPEQVTGDPVSAATDVHAWGLCVLFAATGRQPFGGDTASTALYRVLEHTPDVPDAVPEPLRALVGAALSKDPSRRPTVDRLQAALSPPKAPPPPPPPAVAMPQTVDVPLTDQWTQRAAEPMAVPPAAAATPPSRPSPAPPAPRRGRGKAIAAGAVALTLLLGGVGAAVLLARDTGTNGDVPAAAGSASASASVDAEPSTSPSTPASASASATAAPPDPVYSVRVNYASKGIPDVTVEDSLGWQVDLCSTDAQLLRAATRERIQLYAKEDGRWTKQPSDVTTNRGDRCGPDGVHVVIDAAEQAPAASALGQGWSDCRDYRVSVPETSTFAKTFVDMCVRTRADTGT